MTSPGGGIHDIDREALRNDAPMATPPEEDDCRIATKVTIIPRKKQNRDVRNHAAVREMKNCCPAMDPPTKVLVPISGAPSCSYQKTD